MNLPTKITISRIVIVVAMLIALFVLSLLNISVPMLGSSGINLVYFMATIVFIIASATDWLDGYLARRNNQITDLGKFLDPIADKLLIDGLLIFLIVAPHYASGNLTFSLWCAIILIARDLIVDALRLIAVTKNKVIAANIFGKAKTVLQMVAIVAILLNGWPFSYFDSGFPNGLKIAEILVYLATAVSLLSGVIYVVQNRQVLMEENKNESAKTS
ncbi:MAG: CDP-diacylglycerol--glycerol-3-phosphate 3-phosphatidyltransferase [Bacilli bacterium]|jgi:CDP-diacylglycerol--glycerol-3-phosphate 3-phosphatidyltransferase|nr:CDP-diacylglycerol--glycerol-3-phosphate 3-phosphatidyltransferase [Bacilli bacterium]